jgi:hypothetical protein
MMTMMLTKWNVSTLILVLQSASFAGAWIVGSSPRYYYDGSGLSSPSSDVTTAFHSINRGSSRCMIWRNRNSILSATIDEKQSNTYRSTSSTTFDSTRTTTTSSDNTVVATLLMVLPHDCRTKKSKYGYHSPVDHPTYYDAALHLAQKCNYFSNNRLRYEMIILNLPTTTTSDDDDDDHDIKMVVVPSIAVSSVVVNKDQNDDDDDDRIWMKLCQAEIVIAMGMTSTPEQQYVQHLFETRRTIHPYTIRNNSDDVPLPALVGPYDPQHPTWISQLLPWTIAASGQRLYVQLQDLFSRYTSDDFCYGIISFLHLFSGYDMDWVRYQTDASWEKGPIQNTKEFYNMISQCRDCIVPCIQDQKCRECLAKMSQLDPRDQATSYRTLVSYESELLTDISRCIFTKKNIFQCNSQIPTYPSVHPIATFRNEPLTEEMGRALLVGHLSKEDTALTGNLQMNVSWMVACGANVAYDQFPHQHQLFYPAAKGRDMWYDPFFRVITLDGRNIWCQRHYKVRPGPQPGTFRLSTSDNGVTSDERWTIIGVADDLSWLLIHYAGAAREVGLQYLGGLLCTPDGTLPQKDPSQMNVIWQCLQNAGIQPWELIVVDNRNDTPNAIDAGLPPLDYYRGAIQKSRQQQITITPPLSTKTTIATNDALTRS